MKRLYISDLDGTLLDDNARLSARSRELLNEAINAGILFTVATARTPATVAPLMYGVKMTMPAIVLTGAAWWHFDRQKYSHVRFVGAENVSWILSVFEDSPVTPFVYVLDNDGSPQLMKVYYGRPDPTEVDRKFISARNSLELKYFVLGERPKEDEFERAVLFFASGSKEDLQNISDKIRASSTVSVSLYEDIYNPGTALIEVFAPNVSKAGAITEMKEIYGIEELVVFGDNLNDLPMFDISQRSVAVSNALPAVRDVADLVIGKNTDDSVAKFILAQALGGSN